MSKDVTNAGGNARIVAPVAASPANDAEFLDARGVEARYSIRRSLLYELHNGGHVKSVSLRRRGQVRGKRLWSIDSIRSYLNSRMEAGE